ncbi:8333_t:CDS:2, partial [Cetraspora pellucida]
MENTKMISQQIRQRLKEAKEHRERNKTQNPLTPELSFSCNNPYVKNNSKNKEQAEDSIDTKSMTSECISDNEKMALEDEVAESTINEEPVNTVYITDSKSTDSMKTEKDKNKRKDQARSSHPYKNEEGSQK